MTSAPAKPQAAGTCSHLIGDAATVAVIALAMVRVLVAFRSMWTMDGMFAADGVPITDIGPMGTAICDALGVAALAAALFDRIRRRVGVHAVLVGLWLVGLVIAAVHIHRGSGDPAIAGNWIGSIALGLAALHLADVSRRRRFMATAAAALLVSLALYAFVQFFIQHPRDIAFYESQKPTFLEQRGWEPGSIQQTKWETRLYQREASGRFGLSNVFGTVVGALTLVAAGLAIGVRRRDEADAKPRAAWMGAMIGVALLGLAALALTFSKGAIGAMVIALVATALAAMGRRTWWRRSVAMGAVAAVVCIVIVRGLIGPPESAAGERSLLFRAMYWQAAAAMVRDQPITGVGPGAFQDRYMIVKNPLSPEDVADPHNVFVNHIATLGIGGLAWCGVLIGMLWMAARGRDDCEKQATPPATPTWAKAMAVAAAALAFGFQATAQLIEMALLEVAAVYIIGLLAFIGLVASLDRIDFNDRRLQLGLLGAAVLILAHGQIEMSVNNTMSAPLLCVLLGIAAAVSQVRPTRRRGAAYGCIALTLVATIWFCVGPVMRTAERSFAIGAAKHAIQNGEFDKAALWLNADRNAALDTPDVQRLTLWALYEQADHDGIVQLAERYADNAAFNRGAADLLARAGRAAAALAAARRMLDAAPYSISYHLFAADLAWSLNRPETAAPWYRRTLALSERAYLDPDAQLADRQIARIESRLLEFNQVDTPNNQRVR